MSLTGNLVGDTAAAVLEDLRNYDPGDGTAFRSLLNRSVAVLCLSDREASMLFDVSGPSVARWRNGETTPAAAIRRIVKRLLEVRLAREAMLGRGGESRAPTPPSIETATKYLRDQGFTVMDTAKLVSLLIEIDQAFAGVYPGNMLDLHKRIQQFVVDHHLAVKAET